MLESLISLSKLITLNYIYKPSSSNYAKILREIHLKTPLSHILISKDYTPFAKLRESAISKFCASSKIIFNSYHNHIIFPISSILNKDGNFFKTGMAYFKAVNLKVSEEKLISSYFSTKPPLSSLLSVLTPRSVSISSPSLITVDLFSFFKVKKSSKISLKGGIEAGELILSSIKNHSNYGKIANREMVPTTRVSPYIKFGCISPKAFYYTVLRDLSSNYEISFQILWREFFYNLYESYKIDFAKEYKENYRKFPWVEGEEAQERLQKWKEGTTGFPLVDAAMRELKEKGFMHHRCRLLTCNFLFKALKVDWREGEKHFARYLLDYDPVINNGNWQYNLGFGTVNEYRGFMALNPFLQAKKIDPNCKYIKKYVKELKDVEVKDIMKWEEKWQDWEDSGYKRPIIDFGEENRKFKEIMQSLKK